MQPPVAKTTERPGALAEIPVSCPRCGAINPAAAAFCHQCRRELPKGAATALDPASARASTFEPLSRPPMRLTTGVLAAGAIVLTTLVVLGNYVYGILSFVDIPIEKGLLATPERGAVKDSRGPEDSGTIGGKPAASGTPAAKASRDVAPFDVPASTPEVVPPDAVSTPSNPPRASPQAAGTAIASPAPSVHRKATASTQPHTAPCTEGMRALGLCTAESTEKRN